METQFISELYNRIHSLCTENHVTITTMCKDAGVSRASLSDLKVGRKQSLSADTLMKIAKYFHVSVDYLVGNVSEPNFHLDNERILRKINGQIKQKGGTQPMDDNLFARDIDAARVIQVIETKAMRGSGTPKQPIREVIQYWSFDGELLAENDPLGHFTGGTDSTSSNVSSASTLQWTADLLGRMHIAGITATKLAKEVGWNPKYLSAVINGHKEPKNAETTLNAALDRLIEKQRQYTAQ